MQFNTNINVCIAKRFFYIASLNDDMFRPLNRSSSGCTFSYFKSKLHNIYIYDSVAKQEYTQSDAIPPTLPKSHTQLFIVIKITVKHNLSYLP
jgi:hypothetical protein